MADLLAHLATYQVPGLPPRNVYVICSNQAEAGKLQRHYAVDVLRQAGAQAGEPGSNKWTLNGHTFQFISAAGRLLQFLIRLREPGQPDNSTVIILMCEQSDLQGYALDLLVKLHQTGNAWVMVPYPRPGSE